MKKLGRSAVLGCIVLNVPAAAMAGELEGPFTYIFDTGTALQGPFTFAALSTRTGWTCVPEDQTTHTFTGDAVICNVRLALVLRPKGTGVEVYARSAGRLTHRATLTPAVDKGPAGTTWSANLVENTRNQVIVDVLSKGTSTGLRCGLQMGRGIIKTEPRGAVPQLRIAAPCRFLVLPDFFADDMVIDAENLPVTTAEIPGEHFLMHMLSTGESILMPVWKKRGDDVRVNLTETKEKRRIVDAEIPYVEGGAIWIALMEGQGIWHVRDVTKADTNRETRLTWKRPFPAAWRVDWHTRAGEIDSWEMMLQKRDGAFVKLDWFGQPENTGTLDWMDKGRKRWNTEFGHFMYPCWIDKNGNGWLQPIAKGAPFLGPAIIYPIDRLKETPLDAFTVVDIVRSTLGVGPCQYILDVEGQHKITAGIPTCDARNRLNRIYQRGEQIEKRTEVEQALANALAFVRHIRGRIHDYVDFAHRLIAYLEKRRTVYPELKDFVDAMTSIARGMDAAVERKKEAINTPAYATKIVNDFRRELVGYTGVDAHARCVEFGKAITTIGGAQDDLVAECRTVVRTLRQRAGLALALDPRVAPIAREIRRRTRDMLRNPVSYEAPRH